MIHQAHLEGCTDLLTYLGVGDVTTGVAGTRLCASMHTNTADCADEVLLG